MSAADRVVRTVEDLLSSAQIRYCPIHIVPARMHAIDIRSSDVVREQLGYVKIRLSMIALRELQSSWPVSRWIYLLFTKVVRQIRDRDGLNAQEESSDTRKTRAGTEASKGALQARDSEIDDRKNTRSATHQSGINLSQAQASQANPSDGSFTWETSNRWAPLNFPANWSGVIEQSLWYDSEFDIINGMPQVEGYG